MGISKIPRFRPILHGGFYRPKLLYRIKLLYRTKVNKNLRLYIVAKQGTYAKIWQEIYSSGIGLLFLREE